MDHVLFPQCGPDRGPRNPTPFPTFEGLPPNRVSVPNGADPASFASVARGAERVESRAFRALDRTGDLETPLRQLDFGARQLNDHLANSGRRYWRIGVRWGPNADGPPEQSPQTTPRGLRRAGVRAILAVSPRPGQVGYPTSGNTDASLGHAITGHQSSFPASQSCDVQRSPLIRLAGQATKGRGAKKAGARATGKGGLLLLLRPPNSHWGPALLCAATLWSPEGERGDDLVDVWSLDWRVFGSPCVRQGKWVRPRGLGLGG